MASFSAWNVISTHGFAAHPPASVWTHTCILTTAGAVMEKKAIISEESKRHVFRSLRTRIVMLALFAAVLLIATGVSFFSYLNSGPRARLESAQKHLRYLAGALEREYKTQLAHGGVSLTRIRRLAPPPPPDGPHKRLSSRDDVLRRPPPPDGPPPHPRPPVPDPSGLPLVSATSSVLRHDPDVEGGFYAADADVLAGYAFPTHEGPGGTTEVPGEERPEIEDIVRTAARTGEVQQQSFHGAYDAILFVAVPIKEEGKITGAAWLMQRMPGLEAGRSQQLLFGSIGFAIAALTCIFFTFFVTSEVNNGVQTVLTRLGVMEGNLGEHPVRPKLQLAEFEQVLERVDALSESLNQKIEAQRALEDEMRHRQRLSALGQFAAGVAHELRNPLATIRLRTQMSQRTKDDGSADRNSAVVLEEVARLDSMIERLLYFSRPIRLHLKRVLVSELCSTSAEAWHSRCTAAGVTLQWSVSEDGDVCCDVSTIRQVLDNLLENALHALVAARPKQAVIEVRGTRRSDMVTIEVRDNGTGLDADAALHALEPFFTTRDAGTGLGLSISYEIMQAHGGDLQLRNCVSGGAVATLSLPGAGPDCEVQA